MMPMPVLATTSTVETRFEWRDLRFFVVTPEPPTQAQVDFQQPRPGRSSSVAAATSRADRHRVEKTGWQVAAKDHQADAATRRPP
jgi:hypothetical protein